MSICSIISKVNITNPCGRYSPGYERTYDPGEAPNGTRIHPMDAELERQEKEKNRQQNSETEKKEANQ